MLSGYAVTTSRPPMLLTKSASDVPVIPRESATAVAALSLPRDPVAPSGEAPTTVLRNQSATAAIGAPPTGRST